MAKGKIEKFGNISEDEYGNICLRNFKIDLSDVKHPLNLSGEHSLEVYFTRLIIERLESVLGKNRNGSSFKTLN